MVCGRERGIIRKNFKNTKPFCFFNNYFYATFVFFSIFACKIVT